MQKLSISTRSIVLVPLLLGVLALSTGAYSSFVDSHSSAADAETRFDRAVRGSQLSASEVDEIALRLEALPPFAEQGPAKAPSIAAEQTGSFGLLAQGALAGD